MKELIEYNGSIPNIADYLISVGMVKEQVVFQVNHKDSRKPIGDDFRVRITMTGVLDSEDLTAMPDINNIVNAEATICYPHYKEHKGDIVRDLWMRLAFLIYNKKGMENVTANRHNGNDKQDH